MRLDEPALTRHRPTKQVNDGVRHHLGRDQREARRRYDVANGVNNRRFINTAPPGKLIPGKSVMFLDSFGLVALTQIVPFFEDLTDYVLVDFNADRYTDLITESDRVWLMTVQRSAGYRLKYEVGAPEFHNQLEAKLPKRDA